ncbi:unnamed protein product [Ophioblennius macclurei]
MQREDVQLGKGTFLMIHGVNMIGDTVVQTPKFLSVAPGESETISCHVHSVHCAANDTDVTWMKNSISSGPEMIQSSGHEPSKCNPMGTGETTCVFDYSMQNLTPDDTGTYYCVVTVCGQLLLGNGTMVQVHDTESFQPHPVTVTLIVSNCVLVLVVLFLLWRLCRKHKKSPITASDRSRDQSPEDNEMSDGVLYTAVRTDHNNSSLRSTLPKHNTDTIAVYSNVRGNR